MERQNTALDCACDICRKQIRLIAYNLKGGGFIKLDKDLEFMINSVSVSYPTTLMFLIIHTSEVTWAVESSFITYQVFPFNRHIKDSQDLQTPRDNSRKPENLPKN